MYWWLCQWLFPIDGLMIIPSAPVTVCDHDPEVVSLPHLEWPCRFWGRYTWLGIKTHPFQQSVKINHW